MPKSQSITHEATTLSFPSMEHDSDDGAADDAGVEGHLPFRQYLVQHKRKLPYLLGNIRYKRPFDEDETGRKEIVDGRELVKKALDYLYGGVRYRRATGAA
ncbi:unnamed protein product [Mesocestoides corti]|uniref:Uncharacterized protein n=1 Tax=Mesocestoides corti TaxID=53468 RepID=A0A0R3U906_MESCO|nr:unnamed protein product [Mesocestoides corti]